MRAIVFPFGWYLNIILHMLQYLWVWPHFLLFGFPCCFLLHLYEQLIWATPTLIFLHFFPSSFYEVHLASITRRKHHNTRKYQQSLLMIKKYLINWNIFFVACFIKWFVDELSEMKVFSKYFISARELWIS